MPQKGMMLQIDGSRHDWLEGRGPWLTLVGAIDDATGEVPYALFRWQEDAQGYFLLLREIALKVGLPLALYSDRHGIFIRSPKEPLSLEEQLKGEQQPTQFGRLLKELDIQPMFARSPQAKGRIERLWGTFQDRLVSELRLAKAKSLAEANQVLWRFLPEYNKRFGVEATQAGSAYRLLAKGLKLKEVFCFKYERVVANNNTIRLDGRVIQIPPGPGGRSYAKARVTIHEAMDGSLGVYYQGKEIAFEEAKEEMAAVRVKPFGHRQGLEEGAIWPSKGQAEQANGVRQGQKLPDGIRRPATNHPWRRYSTVTNSLNT